MQLTLDYADLPAYQVRESGRAKRPSVTVCLHEGIVVTVPKHFNQKRLPALLAEWQPWLQRQLAQVQKQQRALAPEMQQAVPERVRLPALGREWNVQRVAGSGSGVRLRETDTSLLLVSAIRSDEEHRAALLRWLSRQARQHLEPLTRKLAGTHGFSFKKISIRGQRTRWGSCSSTGTISLNYYLMFLAPELVNAVVMHELCHTRHMNHGPRFHALVEALVPGHRSLDQRINAGWQEIPAWAWRRGQSNRTCKKKGPEV